MQNMNRRQKIILAKFLIVITITSVTVTGMIFLRTFVNRSEAKRALQQLGEIVEQYRKQNGAIPPESFFAEVKQNLEGHVRLGNIIYRARWIRINSPQDSILAYAEEKYFSPFVRKGVIVLRLNGQVQWMDKDTFRELLASQQSPFEVQMSSRELF